MSLARADIDELGDVPCPLGLPRQLVADQQQLEPKPVGALAGAVIRPDLVNARGRAVLQQKSIACFQQSRGPCGRGLELGVDDCQHGFPVAAETSIGEVLLSAQQLALLEGRIARQARKLLCNGPELQRLERALRGPERPPGPRLARRLQLQLRRAEVVVAAQEARAAEPVPGLLAARAVEADGADLPALRRARVPDEDGPRLRLEPREIGVRSELAGKD
mmetsp:Transcript_37048/g.105915  ORF Transcript_37048/g.105915 Transcript_37048/m.105915 type:complete len:220 (+) Transcript_37048:383-1042(+)